MKLLLTNDDGIDAPGIAALEAGLDGDVYVAAPNIERSECGHQVTTRTEIEIDRRSDRRIAVAGTPADCVRLALRGQLFEGVEFDWVLSGINAGGNLGVDIHISGTVAAAREAAILERRSVAFSHYRRAGVEIDWKWASDQVRRVFKEVRAEDYPEKGFWNVNFPHETRRDEEQPSVTHCSPCRNPLPVNYQTKANRYQYSGVYAQRQGEEGSDVRVCFGGEIAVSRIHL